MKLTSRGFTLVELMIVIAIIGILAAALFPSMTNYLKRSRDAARSAGIKDISTALGAYYADNEKYPDSDNGCINSGVLDTKYMPKGVPQDPQDGHKNGCANARQYGFGSTGSGGVIAPVFLLMAEFENPVGGNRGTGALQSNAGTGVITETPAYTLTKGAGPWFIALQ